MTDTDPRIEKALKIVRGPFRAGLWPALTLRECRILSYSIMGMNNTEVGKQLNMTRQGATLHLNKACKKIGTTPDKLATFVLRQIEKALTE